MSRATGPGGRSSSPIPSATSKSVSQRCLLSGPNSICSLQSTGLQVRLHRTSRASHDADLSSLPQGLDRGRALQKPYCAERQRVHFTTPGNRCSAVAEIKLAFNRESSSAPTPSSSPALRPRSTTADRGVMVMHSRASVTVECATVGSRIRGWVHCPFRRQSARHSQCPDD